MILGIDVGGTHTDAVLMEGSEEIFTDTASYNGTFT
jgi:N-methylhydantoinase A/oxoprolinase/acetone carboxylase beta subunit